MRFFLALFAVAVMAATMPLSEALTAEAVVLSQAQAAEVTCDPTELILCLKKFGASPSQECCNKLKEQEPCLCGYEKDPKLKHYFDDPDAKIFALKCGVLLPKC